MGGGKSPTSLIRDLLSTNVNASRTVHSSDHFWSLAIAKPESTFMTFVNKSPHNANVRELLYLLRSTHIYALHWTYFEHHRNLQARFSSTQ